MEYERKLEEYKNMYRFLTGGSKTILKNRRRKLINEGIQKDYFERHRALSEVIFEEFENKDCK